VCQSDKGGSIDPSVFVDGDGARWLLWKNDGNCCQVPSQLWSQRLSVSSTLEGESIAILTLDSPWEFGNVPGRQTIEAPELVRGDDGTLHLFYSGNGWDTPYYAVGHAVCESPSGPCERPSDFPVLSARGPIEGPGGASTVVGPDGEVWLAYHAWPRGGVRSESGRQLWLSHLHLEGDVAVVLGPQEEVLVNLRS
jgi:beta-xylosidase